MMKKLAPTIKTKNKIKRFLMHNSGFNYNLVRRYCAIKIEKKKLSVSPQISYKF